MSRSPVNTQPYWSASATVPPFPRLADAGTADVVVVGGGITGLTTAYLLSQAGRRVVLLERARCGLADTGHTSAHLTMVTDARLTELVKRFGRPHAQAVWDSGLAAIAEIEAIVGREGIAAGFERIDGYLHAPAGAPDSDADGLRADATLATELGFDAEFVSDVPVVHTPGMRVEHQARLHPRAYLAGLAAAVTAAGGRIFEHSEAATFETQPRGVRANGHLVTCDHVVMATHNPLVGWAGSAGAAAFQTKLALYTSYVLAAEVPKGVVPDALWWDTADPYTYLRVEPGRDIDRVIIGGQDHKTGQVEDTEACLASLRRDLATLLPGARVVHQWSGQVIETPDGLPYIGASAEGQYIATGFSGNGLTFGTVAAMMMRDAILGQRNPWADLYEPGRKALTRGLWDYLKENIDYPYYMIRDRFAGAETRSLRAVKPGEGRLVNRKGHTVAAYRDPSGALTLKSSVCTHMGCAVAWNTAERTWDCPCHGSRFKPTGEVISGPAETPLGDVD